ncbi:MAG: DUF58 domain-containing protein [Sulfurovum sp.]
MISDLLPDPYKSLQIKAKRDMYRLLSGNFLSSLHGDGYDFAQLREYQIGDDIRKINWTISAKLNKPYIKELHSNKELSIVVASLMDGSLYFKDGNKKQDKITEVATILGYASQNSNDLFRGVIYTQDNIYSTPPTKQLYHIEEFSKRLFEAKLLKTTLDRQSAIDELFGRIEKRSIIFILSDGLEYIDLSLLSQKHEVVVISVRDEEEITPSPWGEVTLQSPQNDQRVERFFNKRAIRDYLKKLQAHDERQREHFDRYNISHTTITTDDDSVVSLMRLFG